MGTANDDAHAKDIFMKEATALFSKSIYPSQIPIKIDMKKPPRMPKAQSLQSEAKNSIKSPSSASGIVSNAESHSNKDYNDNITLSSSKCQRQPIGSQSENCSMMTNQKKERRIPKTMSCGANFPNTYVPSQELIAPIERNQLVKNLKRSASAYLKRLEDIVPEFEKLLKIHQEKKSSLPDEEFISEDVVALARVDSPKTSICIDSIQCVGNGQGNNNMVTPTWDSEEHPNVTICCVSPSPPSKNKKRPLRRDPLECAPPKVIPLGIREEEQTPNNVTSQQTCETMDKIRNQDSGRKVSSFKVCNYLANSNSPQPSRDSSIVPSRETSFLRDGRKYGELIVGGENALKSRSFYSSTYEGLFYRKKAFSKGRTPTYARSPSSTPKNSSSFANDALFQAEQRFTKIFTKTKVEEYEEHEESVGGGGGGVERTKKKTQPKKSASGKSTKDSSTPSPLPPKSIMGKTRSKSPVTRVTIKENPPASSSSSKKVAGTSLKSSACKVKKIEGTCVDGKCQKNNLQNKSQSNKALSRGKQSKSKIPRRMMLPGHGDPHMEIPDTPSRKSDLSKTSEEKSDLSKPSEEKSEHVKRCSCEKCKVYKNLLYQSESTVRYLTQILVSKDREINTLKDICGSSLLQGSTDAGKDSPTPINPLVKKAEENTEDAADPDHTTIPNEKPRARCDHGTAIPQFDLDEFIRKYFKHALHIKDFSTNNKEPFATEQLLRVAISARDCMAQIVKHKLKHANNHLKQKYDTLVSMKSSSSFEESAYFSVLDSYRRFIRYIYFYWKESMKKVENFELSCITQTQNEIFDGSTKRKQIVYWHDTCLEIDGKKYSGTFIPFRDISEDKETCDCDTLKEENW